MLRCYPRNAAPSNCEPRLCPTPRISLSVMECGSPLPLWLLYDLTHLPTGLDWPSYERFFHEGGPVRSKPVRPSPTGGLRASTFGNQKGPEAHALDVVHLSANRWAGFQFHVETLLNQESRRGQSVPRSSGSRTEIAEMRGGRCGYGRPVGEGNLRLP